MTTLTVPYALEYCGYLVERMAAIGDTEIASLDMAAQTEHFYSSGALEPIRSEGMSARYRILSASVPQWLIDGYTPGSGAENAARLAVKIVTSYTDGHCDQYTALRHLSVDGKGKFAQSLIEQFRAKGYLSPAQCNAVIAGRDAFRRRNRY